ncbi:MAG: class I SAM-dependent methyltransferase [Pyrinomonadaceae bacterium]|nr:class I SAM-dependent methyltransferase [Pyrinomonadaceae bacterium]
MKKSDELLKYVEWDVKNWSVALDFWQKNSAKKLFESRVLEIGGGFGGLSLWFAKQGAHVVCSDFQGVSQIAVELHRAHNVTHLIEYETIHALDIPYTEEFDIVVFKSVIGVLDDYESQKKAVGGEMYRALKKNGELFFAENLVGSPAHMFLRKKMIRWGNEWRYIKIKEMKDFLAPFSETKLYVHGFAGTFGRNERQRNLLGFGDQLIFERIVPKNWKYIISGVAVK